MRDGVRRLEALAPAGRWAGFPTLAGRSDVWVTGFTAAHLRAIAPRHRHLARARRVLARAQQANGGWGYGGHGVPADADSTVWCLAAIGSSPVLSDRARARAAEFLESHRTDRGFVTYLPESGIGKFIQAPDHASLSGWTSVHPDVTAAALAGKSPPLDRPLAHALLGRLAASQTAAGLIPAYWWRCAWYTLTLTLRACCVHRVRPPERFVRRALEALEGKRLGHGGYGIGGGDALDPFTTALALEAYLRLAGPRNRTVSAIAFALSAAQGEDGGWEGGYVLRIPAPSVSDPASVSDWTAGTGGGNALVKDEDGVFATVLASYALALYGKARRGGRVGLRRGWPELSAPVLRPDPAIVTVRVTNPPADDPCGM